MGGLGTGRGIDLVVADAPGSTRPHRGQDLASGASEPLQRGQTMSVAKFKLPLRARLRLEYRESISQPLCTRNYVENRKCLDYR